MTLTYFGQNFLKLGKKPFYAITLILSEDSLPTVIGHGLGIWAHLRGGFRVQPPPHSWMTPFLLQKPKAAQKCA